MRLTVLKTNCLEYFSQFMHAPDWSDIIKNSTTPETFSFECTVWFPGWKISEVLLSRYKLTLAAKEERVRHDSTGQWWLGDGTMWYTTQQTNLTHTQIRNRQIYENIMITVNACSIIKSLSDTECILIIILV